MVTKGAAYNLISLTQFTEKGWLMSGNSESIVVSKDGMQMKFDIKINTARGAIFAVYFKRIAVDVGLGSIAVHKWNLDVLHRRFGHSSDDATRATAKALGYEVARGSMKPCMACTISKAKQKNVEKNSVEHVVATKDQLRMFVDLSWFKQPKEGPKISKWYWRLCGDERTQLKFSAFSETKDAMVKEMMEQLIEWKNNGYNVKWIRCDNAGENLLLKDKCASVEYMLPITFEFTARDTPQQNWLVERGFPVIATKARAMMAEANVPTSLKYLLFREALMTATLLDGLVVQEVDGKAATRFVQFYGENPKWVKFLRTWGETGTVKVITKTSAKLVDRGAQCMFVGYALNHTGDTYRMYDPQSKRVHITRDVIWLKRMFFQKEAVVPEVAVMPLTLIIDGDEE
jgi:hypothetical protein